MVVVVVIVVVVVVIVVVVIVIAVIVIQVIVDVPNQTRNLRMDACGGGKWALLSGQQITVLCND